MKALVKQTDGIEKTADCGIDYFPVGTSLSSADRTATHSYENLQTPAEVESGAPSDPLFSSPPSPEAPRTPKNQTRSGLGPVNRRP